MTHAIFYLVSLAAVLSGVLAYPATTANDRQSKTPAADYLNKGIESLRENLESRQTEHISHPDITQAVTSRPSYSTEYNVRQDPPPSEDDLQRYRRQAEGAEAESYEEEDDDSDMYMEPIDSEKSETEHSHVVSTSQPVTVAPSETPRTTKDNQQMGQHFFPSFAPVFSLGHSRPHQLFHQEPFYTSKARVATTFGSEYNPFRSYRDNTFKVPISFEDDAISTNILGSGNFGVLRGGTYYNDDDDYSGGLFGSHYSNNGHGRPYYTNPRPQKYTNGDFFSNFRDFAEINTPTKASYSQYIVVYINKNGTKSSAEGETDIADADEDGDQEPVTPSPRSITKPKNIFEQLILLDQNESSQMGDEMDGGSAEELDGPSQKKVSLHKRKLALLKQEKLNKDKKSNYKSRESGKDLLEPLLALS